MKKCTKKFNYLVTLLKQDFDNQAIRQQALYGDSKSTASSYVFTEILKMWCAIKTKPLFMWNGAGNINNIDIMFFTKYSQSVMDILDSKLYIGFNDKIYQIKMFENKDNYNKFINIFCSTISKDSVQVLN